MRLIRNYDVASYYPHLMTLMGYCSRNIPSPQTFADTLEKRVEAKRAGDKATANALKLVLNTTYGAMLRSGNDLYDPLMGRSVCITGQLFLLELSEHLVKDCKTLKIVQLNTDGIMVSFDDSEYSIVKDIVQEWQDRTGFTLEEDCVKSIIQKDVNNYIEVAEDGSLKLKGELLVRGIGQAGAFKINNNATIVAKAVTDYFVQGIPAEATISSCDEVLSFQLIAKASSLYRAVYRISGDVREQVQRVNRVYASKDKSLGTLYKEHAQTGQLSKVADMPEHCIVDNNNELSVDDIDKDWYIALAKRYINMFLGVKESKPKKSRKSKSDLNGENYNNTLLEVEPMAETKLTIYEKLAKSRLEFLEEGTKKSGVNPDGEWDYFTLEDIVPSATRILNENRLIFVVTFPDGEPTGTLYDFDSTDTIVFKCAKVEGAITTSKGNRIMMDIQSEGAKQTYHRRYLYMQLLDIVVSDPIDGMNENSVSIAPKPTTKPTPPPTPQQRAEIAKDIVNTDGQAEETQIKGLKNALQELRAVNPDAESFVQNIVYQTNKFTNISKSECSAYIKQVAEAIESAKKETANAE